jgi:hypothetical protein
VKLAVVPFVILLAGCSSTIQVRVDEPLNNDRVFNFDQVNAVVETSPGTVVCSNGASYEVSGTTVSRDSTIFLGLDSGVRHSIATRDLLKIQRKNYGSGAISGGLFGSLVGLATGVAIWALLPDHSPDSRMGGAVLILGGLGGGAIIGAVIGSQMGSTQEFQFQTTQSPSRSSVDSTKAGAL